MPPRVLHRLVIRHPHRDAVLVVREGTWQLPEVTLEERHTAEVEHINAAARHNWGVETVVLTALEYSHDSRGIRCAHALEALETDAAPLVFPRDDRRAWLSLDELAGLAVSTGDRHLIRTALISSSVVDGREWMRPGWWATVREWVGTHVGDADIVQIRAWESSCVASVRRRDEARAACFFKALPTSGAHEARVTDYLSRSAAPGVPHVRAVDLERRWLLMHAFHGRALDDDREPGSWERSAATYGRLQAATAGHVDELRALGCAERRLADLAAAIEPLAADTQALMPDNQEGLSREQIEAFGRLAPELRRTCEALAAMRLPPTLDHGDLWPSNILVSEADCVVIDWEDACINQPFLGLGPFIARLRESHIDLPLERVAAAYLAAFADVGPKADLDRAFALSVPLAMLDMAVRYWRVPTEVSAAHPWMREMVPYFLRQVLNVR